MWNSFGHLVSGEQFIMKSIPRILGSEYYILTFSTKGPRSQFIGAGLGGPIALLRYHTFSFVKLGGRAQAPPPKEAPRPQKA